MAYSNHKPYSKTYGWFGVYVYGHEEEDIFFVDNVILFDTDITPEWVSNISMPRKISFNNYMVAQENMKPIEKMFLIIVQAIQYAESKYDNRHNLIFDEMEQTLRQAAESAEG